MYSFEFLNDFNKYNIFIVFHNEKENIESNLVDGMVKKISAELKQRFSDRTPEERCLVLRFPSDNSSEYVFNQFFDSPFCASIFHQEFKGLLIVDCSECTDKSRKIADLVKYIKENSSDDFKFIVLFNASYKEFVKRIFEKNAVASIHYHELELDKRFVENFKNVLTQKNYAVFKEKLDNNIQLRHCSLSEMKTVVKNQDKLEAYLEELINAPNNIKRIGF